MPLIPVYPTYKVAEDELHGSPVVALRICFFSLLLSKWKIIKQTFYSVLLHMNIFNVQCKISLETLPLQPRSHDIYDHLLLSIISITIPLIFHLTKYGLPA